MAPHDPGSAHISSHLISADGPFSHSLGSNRFSPASEPLHTFLISLPICRVCPFSALLPYLPSSFIWLLDSDEMSPPLEGLRWPFLVCLHAPLVYSHGPLYLPLLPLITPSGSDKSTPGSLNKLCWGQRLQSIKFFSLLYYQHIVNTQKMWIRWI